MRQTDPFARGRCALLAAGLAWLSSGPVQAQSAEPEPAPAEAPPTAEPASELPAAYTEAVKLGLDEYERGNYEEARARLLQAHQAFPNARSLRFLGKVEYDLKNYLASIDYLQRSLNESVRPLSPKLRADVERVLGLARGYVATYTVRLKPDEAHLHVDGNLVELGAQAQVDLQVGQHTLMAAAEGYQSQKKLVEVVGGRDESLDIHLQKLPDTAHHRRKWAIIGSVAAVVVAAAATGVALSLRDPGVEDPDGGSTGETIFLSF